MAIEQNKAIAKRLVEEVICRGDEDAFDELVAEDYVDHAGASDRETYRTMVLATREALADLDMRIEGMIAEGDLVAVRLRATAKHVGEFLGYPATGRTITWTGMGWFRIEGGRLRERWNESDVYGIAEQLRE
jgi:steroid delta-isomerase-like uncharacterized protein